ncbi:MAG: SapC family protein [Acidihalobacter sp.]
MTLLFYTRPVVLNKERHRDLRLLHGEARYGFARQTNSVPLVGSEFAASAGHYPIVFAGVEAGALMPVALLGMRDRENLFVDEAGRWQADYVPAFVRRYPFVLAEQEADSEGDERFNVCFDEVFDGLGEGEEGVRLFEDDGEPAEFLRGAMDFLRDYQAQAEATRAFMEQLKELDLLVERHLEVQRPGGERLNLNGFHVVDDARLQALDDAQVLSLFRSGALAWIEAHRLSLARVSDLSARLERLAAHTLEEDSSPVSEAEPID